MQSTGASTPQNNPPTPQPQEAAADCSICLTSFEGKTVTVTKCEHTFHKECLDTWLKYNTTCPMCRTALNERAVASQTLPLPNGMSPGLLALFFQQQISNGRTAARQARFNDMQARLNEMSPDSEQSSAMLRQRRVLISLCEYAASQVRNLP